MAPSARVPIWFVFVTFGLGHLFGNNVRICLCQIQTRIGCLTPCSKEREMCVCVHVSVDGHLRAANEPGDCPWEKARERVGQANLKKNFSHFYLSQPYRVGVGVDMDLGKEVMGICLPQINRHLERTAKYTYRGRNGLPSYSLF